MNSARVTVIGGGIGGLAAAVALARLGAEVLVCEQAAEISEVGAGLQISPNGGAVLSALGLQDRLNQASMLAESVCLRDYRAGQQVLRIGLEKSKPYRFFHRADLIGLLERAAHEAGVTIKTGCSVKKVVDDPGGPVAVHLATEDVFYTDIAIGADGVKSVVRPYLNGPEVPFFTQHAAWRCLVPLDRSVPNVATVHMAPGRHVVTYPLRQGSVMNVVAVQEQQEWVEETWNQEGDPATMRAVFWDFCPEIKCIFDRVEKVHLWGLFRHRVAPVWAKGRVAILGDAAHPTLPFMAQGACMALEDAWVLAQSLAGSGWRPEGLRRYEAIRRTRAERVVEAANKNARNYHLKAAPVRLLAHSALRGLGAVAPSLALRKFDWIYGYDVTSDPAVQAASSIQKGT